MKTKRLEVKEGSLSIPIYEFSDGRYCVDTVLGGKRKRITRASLDAAKIEARRLPARKGKIDSAWSFFADGCGGVNFFA